jgi:response regulator RpfG family c-di-GMP phosphodiesterase
MEKNIFTARPRILCVDDELSNLNLLEAILMPKGYEVIKAENGREAQQRIAEQRIDIVLLDVMMPGINGFDICRAIKEDERYRNIPVVMITSLKSKGDRIKGIKAGAEDFISKPIDQGEVLARIKMLLNVKSLNDRLTFAYTNINSLTSFGEEIIANFNPMSFNFISKIDDIVNQIIRKTSDRIEKPQVIIVGTLDGNDRWQWYRYESMLGKLQRDPLKMDLQHSMDIQMDSQGVVVYNNSELKGQKIAPLIKRLETASVEVLNMVNYISYNLCILALNYGREVTTYDASVLNSLVMQSLFLKSLSGQMKEVEDAFAYTIGALARAAEANDEDTGNHITRVGEYCSLIARQIGMSDKFANIIRSQAQMHDVGKIHTPPEILKKPGKLTNEEFDEMKRHPINGAKIVGEHSRLAMARAIAFTHHERWDGSGYPHKLKGGHIPIEGRILNIADQYDALRNKRVYKPAYDHDTTCKIILEGDGRTMPHHFDPQVFGAFKEMSSQFEEIYERLKE